MPPCTVHPCLVEPGGVQTNYATTSLREIPMHPAYAAADSPTRVIERYIADPAARKTWSSSESVARAMYTIASRGQPIPLRTPLGPDAWGMMSAEVSLIERSLADTKELAFSVGNAGHLEAVVQLAASFQKSKP
jgi:hypothetical protein